MKNPFLLLILLSSTGLTISRCDKESLPKGTPDCIREKIREIENEKVWNPAAKIWQYEYQGKTVYYLPSHCCDIPGMVLDENCQTICSPDGGITGKGDGRCPDFFSTRKNEKLIWEDKRK